MATTGSMSIVAFSSNIGLMFLALVPAKIMADDSSVRLAVEERMENKVEKGHFLDSAFILMMIGMLILTLLTIWLFKVKRFRYMHETGLCMIYGMIIGAIVKYSGGVSQTGYRLPQPINMSKAPDTIWLKTLSGFSYSYSLKGMLYTTRRQGDEFESKAVFDAEIFFYVLLPPIIFFAGYDMKKRFFFRNIGAILMYAFIGTTISCIVFGTMIYAYTKMVPSKIYEDFGYLKCLLFGSLISATDPVTVLAIFHDLHVDVDLYALVFGESVMNDAVAIVLYRSIDSYKSASFEALSFFKAVGEFVGVFGGSFFIGCVMGLATALLTKLTNIKQFPQLETALFALMSYSTFLLAEVAGLTGIVAVLFCGISQAHYTYNNLSAESQVSTKNIFGLLNFLAENFIFSYMGLTVFTFSQHHWDAGFIAWSFLALALSRLCNIYPLSLILNLGRSRKIRWNFQNMLMFAGLRGAVAFALAIRNTSSVPRQLMLTTVLMIVLVTVIGNGGLTMRVLQYLNIRVGVNIEEEYNKDFVSDPDDSTLREEMGYDRSFLTRKWHRFDVRYMKPLFTNKGPPLSEALPDWCAPCVSCFSRPVERNESKEVTQSTDMDMDDELITIEGAVRPNSPEVIVRPDFDMKGRTVSEDQAADLSSGALRIRLDSIQ